MKQRSLLLLLLVLAIAGAAVFWTQGRGAAGSRGGAAAPLSTRSTASTENAPAAELAGGADAPGSGTRPEAPAPTRDGREVARSDYERELATAVWVEGRVVFPDGTPLEERARVVAKGRAFEHAPDRSAEHAVDVAPDGSFRVAFSPRTRNGTLRLEATWLLLDEPVKVPLGDDAGRLAPVVLLPRLGGVVRGTVVPPEGADPATLAGSSVVLWGHDMDREGGWNSRLHLTSELGPGLDYEFRALPPEGRYDVACDPEIFVPAEVEDLLVEPGKVTRFDLELGTGAAVFGRVTDEAGAPLERAVVTVEVAGDSGWSAANHRFRLSDADGAFRVAGLAAGAATLTVHSKGLEDPKIELGSLRAGDERDAGAIALGRGRTIAGVVRWPDGTPAAQARVRPELGEDPWSTNDDVRTDEQGRFEITGLEAGSYRIDATAVKKSRITVTSRVTGKERERTVSETLQAAALDVDVGTRGLVLVLSEGLKLSGRVVDDVGAPIRSFKLTYGRRTASGNSVSVTYDGRRVVNDDEGLFEIDGLVPGGLALKVAADGYLQQSEIVLELPLEDGGERIDDVRLVRAARIAGVVLLPNGGPAEGARLEIGTEQRFEGVDLGATRTSWNDEMTTLEVPVGDDGAFDLAEFPPTRTRIVARRNGSMPSEPLELALAPGDVRAGLVLRLSTGARLTGIVLGPGGRPAPRRIVTLSPDRAVHGWETMTGSTEQTAQSASDGAFEFAGLAAGAYEIVAEPTAAELDQLGFGGLAGAADSLASRADVRLTEAGAHVVVEPPATRAVRVFGIVRVNGEPAPAEITIYGLGMRFVENTRASSDGDYAVLVPAPGRYRLSVAPALDGEARTERELDVPATAEHRRDVDLAIGGISGRVVGRDGPIAGVPVRARLARDEHGAPATGWGNVDTDRDGRFAFPGLAAGEWTVSAGGPQNQGWGAIAEKTRYLGEAVLQDVRIRSGEAVTDVELRVSPAGAIAGGVRRADGTPAAEADLRLRGPDGEVVPLHARTRASGTFEIGGLEPGTYRIGALTDDEVTEGEVSVAVRAGDDAEVALALTAGTVIRVTVTDADGEPREAHVTCRRADGAELTSWSRSSAAGGPGRRNLGPLPPGEYVVAADAQGSRKTERTVVLDGEAEMEVRIQLP